MKTAAEKAWQARVRAERREKGLCRDCGEPLAPTSHVMCPYHLKAHRERERERKGCLPWAMAWKLGRLGRPPKQLSENS